MADSTINSYTAGSALVGTEIFEGVLSPFGAGDDRKWTATQLKTFTSASPTLVTPALGVGTATSLAIGGATLSSNALAVVGTSLFTGAITSNDSIIAAYFLDGNSVFSGGYDGSYVLGAQVRSGAAYSWSATADARGATDLKLYRDAANILAQRNGVSAQTHRVYNTFTDASNGEWGTYNWADTANVLTIGTKMNGTGAARALKFIAGGTAWLDVATTGIATLANELITIASSTTRAGLNLPSGTAPTSPVDGDIWYDGTNLKVRLAGTTKTVTVS